MKTSYVVYVDQNTVANYALETDISKAKNSILLDCCVLWLQLNYMLATKKGLQSVSVCVFVCLFCFVVAVVYFQKAECKFSQLKVRY